MNDCPKGHSRDERPEDSAKVQLRLLDARSSRSQETLDEVRDGAGGFGNSCGPQTIAMVAHERLSLTPHSGFRFGPPLSRPNRRWAPCRRLER